MKSLVTLVALLPLAVFAQPINSMNNPDLPGYQNPSQVRMSQQMNDQQLQQQSMLNQDVSSSNNMLNQQLQSNMNNDSQRVLDLQPGTQIMPNQGGGMLSGDGQQHMLNQ